MGQCWSKLLSKWTVRQTHVRGPLLTHLDVIVHITIYVTLLRYRLMETYIRQVKNPTGPVHLHPTISPMAPFFTHPPKSYIYSSLYSTTVH